MAQAQTGEYIAHGRHPAAWHACGRLARHLRGRSHPRPSRPAPEGQSGRQPMSPMHASWLRPRWLFSRRAVKTLLWLVLVVAAAVGANVAGIYLVGSVAARSEERRVGKECGRT